MDVMAWLLPTHGPAIVSAALLLLVRALVLAPLPSHPRPPGTAPGNECPWEDEDEEKKTLVSVWGWRGQRAFVMCSATFTATHAPGPWRSLDMPDASTAALLPTALFACPLPLPLPSVRLGSTRAARMVRASPVTAW